MLTRTRSHAFAAILAILLSAPVAAQGLMADMHQDVNTLQRKLIGLANAIPDSAYAWRPGAGVRSVGEVFLHVAADNYLIPINMGQPAPASSGIVATDPQTVAAFEARTLSKAAIIAELEASFAHLHQAMGLTTDANLADSIPFFGQRWTRRRAMVLTVTHLHEHLGQAIAYARSNGVTPPWSR